MSRVLVFRKRILPYSETFIAAQGKHLPNYSAVYCGFKREASGYSMVADAPILLQEELAIFPRLARLATRSGFGPNRRWREAMESQQARLMHAHFGPDGVAALPIADSLNLPLVVTFHGFDITTNEPRPAYAKARPAVFARANRIIAVSDFIQDKLIDAGCPEDKIVKHRIGIDLTRFSGIKEESSEPTILFVGRLTAKKGGEYLLAAAAQIARKHPGLKLQIVGTGKQQTKLQKIATEQNLTVEFLGNRSQAEIAQLMLRSWLFCVPSNTAPGGDSEGMGMVFLEAQALETPVVSFAHGGVVEAVAHMETGLLAEERNVAQLSEYLDQLLSDEALRRKMGRRGKARMHEEFDVCKQCALLENIYTEVS